MTFCTAAAALEPTREHADYCRSEEKNLLNDPVPEINKTHLKLALARKDADPFVVIVCDDDVAVGVHGHTCRPLQLTRSPAPDAETTSELAVVGENLDLVKK